MRRFCNMVAITVEVLAAVVVMALILAVATVFMIELMVS